MLHFLSALVRIYDLGRSLVDVHKRLNRLVCCPWKTLSVEQKIHFTFQQFIGEESILCSPPLVLHESFRSFFVVFILLCVMEDSYMLRFSTLLKENIFSFILLNQNVTTSVLYSAWDLKRKKSMVWTQCLRALTDRNSLSCQNTFFSASIERLHVNT